MNDNHEKAIKILRWAKERYTTKGKIIIGPGQRMSWEKGWLVTHKGGKPTAYTRIIDAAIDKYILNK
jgi:hypothetical protein